YWRELPPQSAALLIEYGGEDDGELTAAENQALDIVGRAAPIHPVTFAREHEAIELAWTVREGLFGLVGRLRPLGTALLIEDVAAHCVECGFCEPVCPSRNVTTTPRQRIVLRREMARQPEGSPVYEALMAEYDYDALQTCAADGTCSNACPVAIDTGKLVKEFRRRERTEREEAVAERVARRY